MPNEILTRAIDAVCDGTHLTADHASAVLDEVMEGRAGEVETAAFLVGLRAKGETVAELTGLARTMRRLAASVESSRDALVDTAGTGGGPSTFNISTAAALVAAAAGAGVAKHGNRSVSSASGSADVLEALGFELELPAERIEHSIDQLGFGFLFAPLHHPAMRHAASVRRELATRTVFNVLGPLTNPAGARTQVVGVYAPELAATLAQVLLQLGAERAFVVHGADGIDELSPTGPNLVWEVVGGEARERLIDPLELGIPRCAPSDLAGGSPEANAATIREIFTGADGPRRHAVLLNGAAAIAAAGRADDLRDGLALATEAVDSGSAGQRLEELVRFSHEGRPDESAPGEAEG
jgi:anthranilate phosphoribosyltransferase